MPTVQQEVLQERRWRPPGRLLLLKERWCCQPALLSMVGWSLQRALWLGPLAPACCQPVQQWILRERS